MAQTTGAFSKSNYKIEVSVNGSSWTNISGMAADVKTSGGEQLTGEQQTAENQAPVVVASNKTAAVKVDVNVLYTETAGEAFQTVWARYESTTKTIFLRWSPKGGNTGDERYVASNNAGTAVACPIVTCLPPDVDANSGDPAMAMFSILAPRLVQEVVP